MGRIVQKVETILGETTTYRYHYSLAGQLVEVSLEGVTVNRYEYDSNGNRLAVNGVIIGHNDNQDRLMQSGKNQYTYTKNCPKISETHFHNGKDIWSISRIDVQLSRTVTG